MQQTDLHESSMIHQYASATWRGSNFQLRCHGQAEHFHLQHMLSEKSNECTRLQEQLHSQMGLIEAIETELAAGQLSVKEVKSSLASLSSEGALASSWYLLHADHADVTCSVSQHLCICQDAESGSLVLIIHAMEFLYHLHGIGQPWQS